MIGPGMVLAGVALAAAPAPAEPFDPARSVVQVINVSQAPDYDSPWNPKSFQVQRGSGAVVEGNRILTSAHAVSFSRYLELKKEN
nr:hypothetical protein [bacterium]